MNTASKIADMAAQPLRVLPVRSPRKEQNRLAKQRQRERQAKAGIVTFTIDLPAADAATVNWLREAASCGREVFNARAFLLGAKFLFNAGNVRGGKKRIKGASK